MRTLRHRARSILEQIPIRVVRTSDLTTATNAPTTTAEQITPKPAAPTPAAAAPPEPTPLFATPHRLEWSTVDDIDPDSTLGAYFRDATDDDVYKWHHYFEIYEEAFGRFRDVKDLRMLEIGVYRGGSLRMWKDYFHPDATIVGIDIDPQAADRADPERNIHVRLGDQADPVFLNAVVEEFGPFDIVLDDGGHKTHQMIESFAHLYLNGLTDRGVYLVEDTHTNYWPAWISDPDGPTFLELCKNLTDRLNEPYHHIDDVHRFLAGKDESRRDVTTDFYAQTYSMTFFDSVVLFEKRPKKFPFAEIR